MLLLSLLKAKKKLKMYNPKSKRTSKQIGAVKKKTLDGLTANKNIDDIRALSKISNVQTQEIKNVSSELSSVSSSVSSKQNKLNLTTTGSSGPATLSNDILNVPDYSLGMGITIGTTAIASGTVGRVLFQGAGNVVQQSSSLFWDNTNGRLGIGTSSPAYKLDVVGNASITTELSVGILGTNGHVYLNRATTGGNVGGIRAQASGSEIGGGGFIDRILCGNGAGLFFYTWTGSGSVSNQRMQIFGTSGNVLIQNGGTFTDAGFRLDVVGTARVQNTLSISNPSFTLGGSITHSANSTLVIAGGPGGGENITIGPSNRIFINAQQSRFPNGSVQIASTLTLGNSGNATSTNMLLMQGSITAGSALGRGIGMDTTLVASANNDVLIGVNINPTFTNGAFTGVANIDLRTKNAGVVIGANYGYGALYGYGNDGIVQVRDAGTGILGSTYSTQLVFRPAGNSAGLNSNYWAYLEQSATAFLLTSGRYQPLYLRAGTGGSTNDMFFQSSTSTVMMIKGTTSNVLIGTTTDAGFKLDVNGTARVLGRLTLGDAGTAGQLYSNPSVGMNFSSGQVTDVFTFTQMNNGIFSTAGAVEQSMLRLGIGQATSAGGNSLGSVIRMIGNVTNSSLTSVYNNIQTNTVINTSGGTTTYRGFYHNPTLTATVGVTHFAFHSTSGRIRFENLPTSPTGLSTGEVWNNLGILTIV